MPPPLVGVAVKVTGVPAQILLSEATMLTEEINGEETPIVILLLVTLPGIIQEALLVITQLTTSPFATVLLLKVGLFVPAGLPLTIH